MLKLIPISLVFLLWGCATTAPRNKENACKLFDERDEWLEPLKEASKKWNIPEHTILSIVYHESKFVADAKPPRKTFLGISLWNRISSALGYSQALTGTWDEYQKETGNTLAVRTDFEDSVDFIGWYLNRSVKRLGISRRNAYHLYLAYHQGDSGFRNKSYLRKPAIKRYARKVQETALAYKNQIRTCS